MSVISSDNFCDPVFIKNLKNDLKFLNNEISPLSQIDLLSEYALRCTSDANSLNSRKWRKDFFKEFLVGTYLKEKPNKDRSEKFKSILLDFNRDPENDFTIIKKGCHICNQEFHFLTEYDDVVIGWAKNEETYQISNAKLFHNACCVNSVIKEYFIAD